MALRYEPFFTIELTHDYYANKRCRGVNLVPDETTEALFRKHRVRFKQVENKVFFLVYSTGDETTGFVPFLPFDPDTTFRFALVVDEYRFFNYTNLTGIAKGTKYVFKNSTVNKLVNVKHLSEPIPAFASGKYVKGQLCTATASGSQVFEATFDKTSGAAPATANSYRLVTCDPPFTSATVIPSSNDPAVFFDYLWYNRGSAASYAAASLTDVVTYASSYYVAAFSAPVTSVSYSIKAYNPVTADFDLAIGVPTYVGFDNAVSEFKIPLASLKSGRYQVTVNGSVQELFVSADTLLKNAPAIVEIYSTVNNADYQLLTNGKLNAPVYTINFANALVFWKYQSKKQISTATDAALKFSNIAFHKMWKTSTPPDLQLFGTSMLQIPLAEVIMSEETANTPVYPQANAPPTVKLQLAQANSLQFIQLVNNGDKFLTSVNTVNF